MSGLGVGFGVGAGAVTDTVAEPRALRSAALVAIGGVVAASLEPLPEGGGRKIATGVGLAIARRIVEAHEGQLRVRSSPGTGSAFSCILPIRTRNLVLGSAASA